MQLQVGDVIIREDFNSMGKITIERVTKTQAISGSFKFRREYTDGGLVRLIGGSTWSTVTYRLADNDLLIKFQKHKLRRFIKGYDFSETPIEKLENIYRILNDTTTR